MKTYTVNHGRDVIASGLTLAETGNFLIRRGGHEWHVRRDHEGPWTLWVRLHRNGELSDWHATDIQVEADNEEQANQAAMEMAARDRAWTQEFRITPEGEG